MLESEYSARVSSGHPSTSTASCLEDARKREAGTNFIIHHHLCSTDFLWNIYINYLWRITAMIHHDQIWHLSIALPCNDNTEFGKLFDCWMQLRAVHACLSGVGHIWKLLTISHHHHRRRRRCRIVVVIIINKCHHPRHYHHRHCLRRYHHLHILETSLSSTLS